MNKLLVTEQDKVQFRTWLEALRSGNYAQSTGQLQDEDGYCCLGVACKVVIPDDKTEFKEDGLVRGSFPNHQPNAPDWLIDINDEFETLTGRSLSRHNDEDGWDFNRIADSLEETFKDELI